jgi:2-dehydropantoate 2-reductase
VVETIKSVAVIGLGAIGSIYAMKLSQYNPNILRVIVDEQRRGRYLNEGVYFNGQRYDFNYVTPEEADEKVDLILVATKSQGLTQAISAMEPFIHDDTIIISLLNGISSPAAIAARYGWDKVLYAFFVGHGSTRIGNEITFDGVGRIVFGPADMQAEKVERVANFFNETKIDYEIPQDILFALWSKFVLNVGINQASAVLRADYGQFQRNKQILDVALDLMQEAITLASAAGIKNVEAIMPWCMEFIRNAPPTFKSSMLQDVEAGRLTEVDLFAGTVCELGEQYCIPTPANRLFYKLIRALESEMGSQ